MKFYATATVLLSSPATAWTLITSNRRTETSLMMSSTRRSFFGSAATTLVAAPFIAYADEETVEETVLAAEESAKEPEIVSDKKDEKVTWSQNDVVDVSDIKEEKEEATLALDAKIEDSIEAVEASVEEEPMEAKAEETFVAMVDEKKVFRELLDERKLITSEEEMGAFRAKLQERIAADPKFADSFEAFLDELTSASG